MNEDKEYLRIAYIYAMENSTDQDTQNGAILVKNGVIIGYGANHFPKGVKETKKRWEKPLKYSFVGHAETNAIYDAARSGNSTEGSTIYCPWCACESCGRAIIQAGIKKVIRHKDYLPNKKWDDSIKIALDMFKEAGVICEELVSIFGYKIKRNGKTLNV